MGDELLRVCLPRIYSHFLVTLSLAFAIIFYLNLNMLPNIFTSQNKLSELNKICLKVLGCNRG